MSSVEIVDAALCTIIDILDDDIEVSQPDPPPFQRHMVLFALGKTKHININFCHVLGVSLSNTKNGHETGPGVSDLSVDP